MMIFLAALALAAAPAPSPANNMTDAEKAEVKAAAQAWGGCLAGGATALIDRNAAAVDAIIKSCAETEAALEAALSRAKGAEAARREIAKVKETTRTSLMSSAPASK